jgi:GNAT superfamily N-acetyltransferase
MLFPSLALAQRLEAHDLWNAQEHIRTQAQLYPETGAATLPIAGGLAVFAGIKSPLSGLYGLGLWEPVTPEHLDQAEVFFHSRGLGMDMEVGVCPFADLSAVRLLAERGYIIHDFMNTYALEVSKLEFEPQLPTGANLRIAERSEARLWFESTEPDRDWAEPDGVSFMVIRTMQKANSQLFLVWMDGKPVSAGAMDMHDGVASFIAGQTLPEYRGRGLQTALLQARLSAAKTAGCNLALTHSRPGNTSQRNILRAGFHLVYTNIELRKARG